LNRRPIVQTAVVAICRHCKGEEADFYPVLCFIRPPLAHAQKRLCCNRQQARESPALFPISCPLSPHLGRFSTFHHRRRLPTARIRGTLEHPPSQPPNHFTDCGGGIFMDLAWDESFAIMAGPADVTEHGPVVNGPERRPNLQAQQITGRSYFTHLQLAAMRAWSLI
jgi:hypothetical protein